MPWAAAGLVFALALWEIFKLCSEIWGLDQYPTIQQTIIRVAQCGEISTLCFIDILLCMFLRHSCLLYNGG